MSDYLLLLNPLECPACRRPHRITHGYGECRNCGMMLFDRNDNFESFVKETGWREFWVFMAEDGWVHYSQLSMRKEALSRKVEVNASPTLSPEEQIRKVRKEARDKIKWYIKSKKTIKSFGR